MSQTSAVPTNGRRRIGSLAYWEADRLDDVLEESLPQMLARRLPELGDAPALRWREDGAWRELSYAALDRDARTIAGALAGRFAPGDRVGVWGRNSVSYVLLHYACAYAGTILTPLNTGWSDDEVRHGVGLTTPSIVFAGATVAGDDLEPRATGLVGGIEVVALDDLLPWAASQPVGDLPVVAPEDPFLIQFTSGTTGRAKGAVVSHRAAVNGAFQRNHHDVIGDDDVWLNPVPYHHIGGSCFVVFGGPLGGGSFVVVDRWNPSEATDLLRTGVITRLGGVPTMLVDLLDRLGDDARDAGIASVGLGGATVSRAVVERIRDQLGAPTVIGYGQSECPLITSTDVADDPETLSRTVGRPLPGATVRIADVLTGETCPVGVPGEIQVQSPNVMAGYWQDPEQTAATMTEDGFLRTGDVGAMDELGYIEFRDRAKDVIIRGGENIYPAEVEELLVQLPQVAAAVLVGVDDARLGETVAGVVVPVPGAEISTDELTAHLTGKVARFKIPIAWRFVDQLPTTASGKIRRVTVRQETNEALATEPGNPEDLTTARS
ncbi:acyl--CoA ligase [Mumia zhuanghuii]|uniref:Class I adenylate-forming enzyme family protein n=2 Tax=Mumia TaxID=1546255 RepID=A0ABW1QKG3_9ACTN|nr:MULTISPECIES: class I adenylate-forming enzyme family protein [Mumia]KAA1423030.1 acyl--CoA ligase [Mumia zhuanghuii]